MRVENTQHLEGYLVGIGIHHKDGSTDYNILEKPIHNRITSGGLDFLYKFSPVVDYIPNNGGWSAVNLWRKADVSYSNQVFTNYFRYGALWAASYGSGTTATSFTDTALANETSAKTSTLQTSNNSDQVFNGTHRNSASSFSIRLTFKFDTVSETTTINEIGIWGSYTNNSTTKEYILFSRIKLDSSVVLQSGDYLLATYQLNVTLAQTDQEYTINDFYGLKDKDGNTLKANYRAYLPYSHKNNWNDTVGYDFLLSTGYGYTTTEGMRLPTCYINPFSMINSNMTQMHYPFIVFFTNDSALPASLNNNVSVWNDTSYVEYIGSGGTFYTKIHPYWGEGPSCTNKYRDRTVTLWSYNPGMVGQPDAYKDFKRMAIGNTMYRFGYDDNGTWVSQAYRKYANESLSITFRTRFITPDTTIETDITPTYYRYAYVDSNGGGTGYLYSPYNDCVSNHRSFCFYVAPNANGFTSFQLYQNGYWYAIQSNTSLYTNYYTITEAFE